jgi:hypothetical protein
MKDMTVSISGSVKIYVIHNVLGGINRRCMRGLIGKTIENGFDFSAVPEGKGKLEKMSMWTSSS